MALVKLIQNLPWKKIRELYRDLSEVVTSIALVLAIGYLLYEVAMADEFAKGLFVGIIATIGGLLWAASFILALFEQAAGET